MRSFARMAGLLAVALASLSHAKAEETRRQYYSPSWMTRTTTATRYSYKTYNFKVKATDSTYKQQVVVYNPTVSKNFVYWYNPETKKYWARCPTVNHPTHGKQVKAGKDYWSILPAEKRKSTLSEIKETDSAGSPKTVRRCPAARTMSRSSARRPPCRRAESVPQAAKPRAPRDPTPLSGGAACEFAPWTTSQDRA